jgi:hypothetical protein
VVQDSRAAKRGIARNRNVNASSASARSRAGAANPVAANPVAANKAAASKAADKADCPCINRRRKPPSAACYASVTCRRFELRLSTPLHNLEAIGCPPLERVRSP